MLNSDLEDLKFCYKL